MKGKKIILVLGCLVVITILLVLFKHDSMVNESQTLVLADANQPAFSLIYLAEEQGYFSENNLDVEYIEYSSGRDALNAVIAGDADIATCFETPVVIQTLNGETLNIITELHTSTKNNGILARIDSGIFKPEDLRGKTIAVTTNSGAEFVAHTLLNEGGLTPGDVEWVNALPTEMVGLLESGEVDAIATWNPHIINARESIGAENVRAFHTSQLKELSMAVGLSTFVENNPELLSVFLESLIQAEIFFEENPEEAKQIISERFPEQDPVVLEEILSYTSFEIRLSNTLSTVLENEAIWFDIFSDDVEGQLDVDAVLFEDYLMGIDPKRVTHLLN